MIRSMASESWDSLCRDVEQLRNMLKTKNNYVSTYKYLQATMSYLKLKNFLYNNSVILLCNMPSEFERIPLDQSKSRHL